MYNDDIDVCIGNACLVHGVVLVLVGDSAGWLLDIYIDVDALIYLPLSVVCVRDPFCLHGQESGLLPPQKQVKTRTATRHTNISQTCNHTYSNTDLLPHTTCIIYHNLHSYRIAIS